MNRYSVGIRRTTQSIVKHHSTTKEYAFEMASSSIKFGRGVTKEIGSDLQGLGLTNNICIITDPYMLTLKPMQTVLESLKKSNIQYKVFSDVSVEPTDESFMKAIDYCKEHKFDGYVAVGGGSVIDTAKACNLYSCNPNNDFFDFVNAPIGKGLPVQRKLKPLIAIPTTAGTGSEATGVSIFDHTESGAKTGIRDRAIRPLMGIIDPDHLEYCGPELTAFTGLDVLCHSIESFTAVRYHDRITGAPSSSLTRPAYQGSNPISDIWSGYALKQCADNIAKAVEHNDPVAREMMALAATAAGTGFGSAGVHIPHAMSYPISSLVRDYKPKTGYSQKGSKKAIVPHGLSVILTAPAVFAWTASADYDRHMKAAELLGANVINKTSTDSGLILADAIRTLLYRWKSFIPDGLNGVGYTDSDIDNLVKGTLPQRKVLDVAPKQATSDDLAAIIQKSMTLF